VSTHNTASYGKDGQGATIRFSVVPCRFDFLMLAATQRGLCSARLGDSPPALEEVLRQEFSAAEIVRDDESLRREVAEVLRLADGEISKTDLPLDITATEFQWRVWNELQDIPFGQTRTYLQIAESLGNVKAVRAVGGACAANGLAIVIPCHRVLSGKQSLTGFRWGIERKAKLLRYEAAKTTPTLFPS
jgi:AraC family transcriptional regulator of adaptative response/methylated-DNA-[protein]-cysteine methyltransferase